jgi:hypothetical protein
MALDERTAQEHLTPDERRGLLRAFADRMLLKITAMDDPEDMPGVERAVRVTAVIERVYSRCDRAERQIHDKTPDPRKLETERALTETAAIKARVELASTLEWADRRRQSLGQWWYAAATEATKPAVNRDQAPARQAATGPQVARADDTNDFLAAPTTPGLKPVSEAERTAAARKPQPPG